MPAPTLPIEGVAYYTIAFKQGIHYSQGWYGTCRNVKLATVWLYDDDKGICLVSFISGHEQKVSDMQDGQLLIPLTVAEAQKVLDSYSAETFAAIDSKSLSMMSSGDYYKGSWGGKKLKHKFSQVVNRG